LECVRHLLAQSKEPYRGEVFQLAGGDALRWNIRRPDIPLLLGSWGAQTIRACIQQIDEIKIGGTTNLAVIPLVRATADQAAQKAGCAPSAVGLVVGAVTVVDRDGAAARALARRKAALYLPIIAQLDHSLDLDPALLGRIEAAAAAYDFDLAGSYISDALLRKLAFAGTPGEVAEQAIELYHAGAARIEFGTPHGLSEAEGLRLLGQGVLPALRSSGVLG
ncbi:MAG: LLM class flavin-dependent oxidoreductase, partial [Chloroflexota bacterium]|nr:LLM class flavin-dependent oxidoreductase [Chloroflexota bacterium]